MERSLRMLHQDQLADDFVATMNRAAEQAVPEAAAVLGRSIQQMTLTDAKAILTDTNDAATQYFWRTSETNLFERLHPIVTKATGETGVTSAYKKMLGNAGFAGAFLGQDAGNLDDYVTQKALDGLFVRRRGRTHPRVPAGPYHGPAANLCSAQFKNEPRSRTCGSASNRTKAAGRAGPA